MFERAEKLGMVASTCNPVSGGGSRIKFKASLSLQARLGYMNSVSKHFFFLNQENKFFPYMEGTTGTKQKSL